MDFFLNTCSYCHKRILSSDHVFCIECHGLLPRTYFNFSISNIVLDKLRTHIPLCASGSFLFYNENQMVQQILWEIKYNGNTHLAKEIGRLAIAGSEESFKKQVDLIIPIPLHKTKLQLRGYNQTAFFAEGMSEILDMPSLLDVLKRSKQTTSQTKLNREDRFQNLDQAFMIENKQKIQGKHVLLVDDVVTTGATLISAGQCLLDAGCASLSIYTLASSFEL
jgi:ComF family protein